MLRHPCRGKRFIMWQQNLERKSNHSNYNGTGELWAMGQLCPLFLSILIHIGSEAWNVWSLILNCYKYFVYQTVHKSIRLWHNMKNNGSRNYTNARFPTLHGINSCQSPVAENVSKPMITPISYTSWKHRFIKMSCINIGSSENWIFSGNWAYIMPRDGLVSAVPKLMVTRTGLNHAPRRGQRCSVKHTTWQHLIHKEIADIGLILTKCSQKMC